jgi:glycosyltransferase involved in cell wall biosynthesis
VRDEQADLVHSNLTAHFLGYWAARRAGVPELWHLHDRAESFDPVHAVSRRLPAAMALFTTEALAQSEPLLLRRPHAVVAPSCIDIEKLRLTPGDAAVRERLGLPPGPFFLTVARLQEHKGHSVLLDAAAKIAASHPEVRWVMAGKASGAEQEAYLERLRTKVQVLGLEGRVIFTGYVPDEEMVPLMREAIAMVHPARTEGYGLVLLEAMACRLPVLAAAASGPAGILVDDVTGLLVPVDDSDALAAGMVRLLSEPGLRERLRGAAEADVRTRSVDAMVEQTVAVYRRMFTHDRL